jgi:RNAse (barnase) inhibitor barstar
VTGEDGVAAQAAAPQSQPPGPQSAAALASLGPGVVPLHAAVDVPALEVACDEAGRPLVVLDTAGVTDKAGFMGAVADALELPEWFGRNWDALADCLRDVPASTLVLWDHWSGLAEARPVLEVALEVLGESGLTVLLADPVVE